MTLSPQKLLCLAFLVALSMQLSPSEASGQFQANPVPLLPRPITSLVRPPVQPSGDWYPYVVARREDREWIRNTPIELRPNRPMHFWGNTRRRILR